MIQNIQSLLLVLLMTCRTSRVAFIFIFWFHFQILGQLWINLPNLCAELGEEVRASTPKISTELSLHSHSLFCYSQW